MRLAYLIELIVTCALGCAVARWELSGPRIMAWDPGRFSWTVELIQLANGFIVGWALGGLVGLVVEVVRGRSPRPWGFGRWVWSLVGSWLVVSVVLKTLVEVTLRLRSAPDRPDHFWDLMPRYWCPLVHEQVQTDLLCLIVTLGLVRRFAHPGPVATDAREWAGRTFAILTAAYSLGSRVAEELCSSEYLP